MSVHGLDLRLFDPDNVRNPESFAIGIEVFASTMNEDTAADLVDVSMTCVMLFELVFSALDETSSLSLSRWILARFPSSAETFRESLARRLLERLSLSLLYLDYDMTVGAPSGLSEARRNVELRHPILDSISSSDGTLTRYGPRNVRDTLDPKLFALAGISVPASGGAADVVAGELLSQQKTVLENYLRILRRSDIKSMLKHVYIYSNERQLSAGRAGIRAAAENVGSSDSFEEEDSAYPMVKPMKSAIRFENAKGFGDWTLLISTNADQNLREQRQKEPKLFAIVVGKLKELSKGHLSGDNYKLLANADGGVPVFEAKLTGDARLVYQIDSILDNDTEGHKQALKIFGVYTHAQLGRRLWNAVSRQGRKRGLEHRKRCNARNRVLASDGGILPQTFPFCPPSSKDEQLNSWEESSGQVDWEDLDELMALQKFIAFSQEYVHSILAYQDVAHIFLPSEFEQKIVAHPKSCYVLGRSGTGKTTVALFKILRIQRAWEELGGSMLRPRQVFVTRSPYLAEKVQEQYENIMAAFDLGLRSREELKKMARTKLATEGDLHASDNLIRRRQDVPSSFSQLHDEHFPLFISYGDLLTLLEADLAGSSPEHNVATPSLLPRFGQKRSLGRALLTYDHFISAYWAYFPYNMTKGLDPKSVFGEFIGVIQGSEKTLTADKHVLDEETYISGLNRRAQSTFSMNRASVYALFKLYMKQKSLAMEYDVADRTHDILQLLGKPLPGQKFDFLYVDEVQDNLIIDALLLRLLCRNPQNGLFWAGDTAQTISDGSSFQFQELKAMMFRFEQSFAPASTIRSASPTLFQLHVNFRSHEGIVRTAHSIVQLLTEFWPDSIDRLSREQGENNGPKPIFFSGWDAEELKYEQFLFGDSSNRIEFGAKQCIIVRNTRTKQHLRKRYGEVGLILTVYESKGLEFDDVLLLDFFMDSGVDSSRWRLVLHPHLFETSRHAGLCSEFKSLYVAITRARQNLWIVDSSEQAEPMRMFWAQNDLIVDCTPGVPLPRRLAASSTSEDWLKTGREMFERQLYDEAAMCYRKANHPREEAVAKAYHSRKIARQTTSGSNVRIDAFVTCARAFILCARGAFAHTSLHQYYADAAECYVEAKDFRAAAECFIHAEQFTAAALAYQQARLFKEATDLIKARADEVDSEVAAEIIDVACIIWFREGKLDEVLTLFSSHEEALEFAEFYEFPVARATILEKMNKLFELGELYVAENETQRAIEIFLQDDQNPASLKRATECILDCLWSLCSLGHFKVGSDARRLLDWAEKVDSSTLAQREKQELAMFKAIVANDVSKLHEFAHTFIAMDRKTAALLCLDRAFAEPFKVYVADATPREAQAILTAFLHYANLLKELAVLPNPAGFASIRALLSCNVSEQQQTIRMSKGTALYSSWLKTTIPHLREDDISIHMSYGHFLSLYKQYFSDYCRRKLLEADKVLRTARVFANPCLPCVVNGLAGAGQECDPNTLHFSGVDIAGYNLRVRLCLQTMLILQNLHWIDLGDIRTEQHRYWLNKLYECLNPPSHHLGSRANFDYSLVPEAASGFQIMSEWVRSLLYSTNGSNLAGDALTLVTKCVLLSSAFDRQKLRVFVTRIPCVLENVDNLGNLAVFLDGSPFSSLWAGLRFLEYILGRRINFDIGVLCHFIDELCCLLMACRGRGLHLAALPRSWILMAFEKVDQLGPKNVLCREELVMTLSSLLRDTYVGQNKDHLMFLGGRLPATCTGLRTIFVARLCKSLGFLYYNFTDPRMREHIESTLLSLHDMGGVIDPLLQQFICATSRGDLFKAVSWSATGTPLDEMVQLVSKHGRPPMRAYHRLIYYGNIYEIPGLLQGTRPYGNIVQRDSTPRTATSPASLAPAPVSCQPGDIPEGTANAHDDDGKDDVADPAAGATDKEHGAARIIQAAYRKAAQGRRNSAARAIQRAYRKWRRRHRDMPKSALIADRERIVHDCFKEAEANDMPRRRYRSLFLGPLPHILLVLEQIEQYAFTNKKKHAKEMQKVEHEEVVKVRDRLNIVARLLKDVIPLQKALAVKSEIHRQRDIEKLVARVAQVQALAGRVPPTDIGGWQNDLALGVKGILQKPKPPKRKLKPRLNVDDDDYDSLYE